MIDANKDGALEPSELEAATKLMQRQRPAKPPADAAQPAAAPAGATTTPTAGR